MTDFCYLEVLAGPQAGLGVVLDDGFLYEIGSGADCHLVLSDESVVEVQAQLYVEQEQLVVVPLRGQTRVNEHLIEESVFLEAGDELTLGGTTLSYEPLQSDNDPAPALSDTFMLAAGEDSEELDASALAATGVFEAGDLVPAGSAEGDSPTFFSLEGDDDWGLEDELPELDRDHQAVVERLRMEAAELRVQLAGSRDEVVRLKDSADEAAEPLADRGELQAELGHWEGRAQVAEGERDALAAEIKRLEGLLGVARRGEVAGREAGAKVAGLTGEVSHVREQRDAFQRELRELRPALEGARAEARRLGETVRRLEGQAAAARAAAEREGKRSLESLARAREEAEEQGREVKEAHEMIKAFGRRARLERSTLNQRTQDLEARVRQLSARCQSLSNQARRAPSEVSERGAPKAVSGATARPQRAPRRRKGAVSMDSILDRAGSQPAPKKATPGKSGRKGAVSLDSIFDRAEAKSPRKGTNPGPS